MTTAQERADRLVKLLNAAGILNEHFDIFKSNIAASLEAYAEELFAERGYAFQDAIQKCLAEKSQAEAEGRRAGRAEGLEEAANICEIKSYPPHDDMRGIVREIRALITNGPAGAIEANEGGKK